MVNSPLIRPLGGPPLDSHWSVMGIFTTIPCWVSLLRGFETVNNEHLKRKPRWATKKPRGVEFCGSLCWLAMYLCIYYIILYHIIVYYSILYYIISYYSILQYIISYYIILQYIILFFDIYINWWPWIYIRWFLFAWIYLFGASK